MMIRIGIVGVGDMGTTHYSNYQYIKDAHVVAFVGISNADKEKAAGWGIPIYGTVESMLAVEEVDVVDVCTPAYLHKEHVLAAVRGGENVICETPVALNEADAREMLAAAKERGVNLYVGQALRFSKAYRLLEGLIKSSIYGKVLDVCFTRITPCPGEDHSEWIFSKHKSGLLPFILHIHELDYLVSLFGRPDNLTFTCSGNPSRDYKEQYRFIYRFKDFNICAEAAWNSTGYPYTTEFRVLFENAVVEYRNGHVTAYQSGAAPRVFDTEEKVKISTGTDMPPAGVYLEELQHFVECIEQARPSEKITEEQLITVMEILTEISG